MANAQNANSGCFSDILRRLLCNGSLRTHPSDHITETEPNTKVFDQPKEVPESIEAAKVQGSATPGVVARLMGLDSLPDTNWVPHAKTPDSVTRSRSVNFMDYLLEFDLSQAQHRRVRTSVSFREVPTSLHQQNRGLLVLYLDSVDQRKSMKSTLRKSEMGTAEEKKQKKEDISKTTKESTRKRAPALKKENPGNNKKISRLKNEPRRVSTKHVSKVGNCNGAKVSGFVPPHKKDIDRNSGSTLKAKSTPSKPKNQKEVPVESKFTKKKKKKQSQRAVNKVLEPECNSENSSPVSVLDLNDSSIIDEISLSEDRRPTQLNSKETNWMVKSVFEEICMEFERQILDLILQEVVDELVGFHMKVLSM